MEKLCPSKKVLLLDRADQAVCWLTAEEAIGLLGRGEVEPLRRRERRKRFSLVRWVRPDDKSSATELSRLRRRYTYGDVHRRETYYNPKGVWTFDRIPDAHKRFFTRVVDGLTA
jgi:hypothetical protein